MFNVGLKIKYSTHYLKIEVDDFYVKRLCGLCGEFSYNPRDDFTSSAGVVEASVAPFANSWLFYYPRYR